MNFSRLLQRAQLLFLRLTGLSVLTTENYVLLVAIATGLLAGLGAALFVYALEGVHGGLAATVESRLRALGLGPSAVIFIPALGGLVVGPLIARFAPEARGHGVPEVMTAVATRGGIMKARVAVVKILASAITIGTGGSVGQEGPMVQIGAASASALAQRLKVPATHMRTIVACGAAGGLAAVFNAPIGGAMFALEVITGELTPAFGAVILSSVSATAVSRGLFGNRPAFLVPQYDLVSTRELALYAVLGILAGLASAAFIRLLYRLEDRVARWQFPPRYKPVIGGLLIGIMGRFVPEIFGTGYGTVEEAIWGRMLPTTLALLVVMKMAATSVTLAFGGSGGVFGPSMFIGAMLGGAFGWAAHALFPSVVAGSGAYALVGMGAVVGGTSLAPLTAIVLLFEMTDDYRVILPAMGATVLSVVVVRLLIGESIYTLRLRAENIPYYPNVELARAHALSVREAMRTDVPSVSPGATATAALALAARSRAAALPVADEDGQVIGVVSLEALSEAVSSERPLAIMSELMTDAAAVRALETDRLDGVLARFSQTDHDTLVVVPDAGSRRISGIVSRRDVLRFYERVLRHGA